MESDFGISGGGEFGGGGLEGVYADFNDGSSFFGYMDSNDNLYIEVNGASVSGSLNNDDFGNPQSYSIYGSDGSGGTVFLNFEHYN